MIDQARHARWMKLDLFARKQRAYNAILPTKVALKTHQTSNFQIGHTWGQATVTIQQLLPPSNWGWQKQNHMLIPNWTEVSAIAAKSFKSVVQNYKCYRSGPSCTALSSCNCQENH